MLHTKFKVINQLVLEKKNLIFYHIWAEWPCLLCDLEKKIFKEFYYIRAWGYHGHVT